MAFSIEALSSIAPYLPVRVDTTNRRVLWPAEVFYALKSVARGPETSDVQNGESLHEVIMDMRSRIQLPDMCKEAGEGLKTFFDVVISPIDAKKFFATTLPSMANLALNLPDLLEEHVSFYGPQSNTDVQNLHLRILFPQNAGAVFLSQELVASLLACAFFCLYPSGIRLRNDLPPINFDLLFGHMVEIRRSQTQKIRCIIHYFERVCDNTPRGMVSYERKVLASDQCMVLDQTLPRMLCEFRVIDEGAIEDAGSIALQVDFANQFLGGGALGSGCVQEEIRFMINPELIAGMLFMASMSDNESIEFIGAERYSCYEGYGPSFSFAGDFVDKESRDVWGRRNTRIVAIDALSRPGENQFRPFLILRELNKAFCGFLDYSIISQHQFRHQTLVTNAESKGADMCHGNTSVKIKGVEVQQYEWDEYANEKIFEKDGESLTKDGATKHTIHGIPEQFGANKVAKLEESTSNDGSKTFEKFHMLSSKGHCIGIATGNWGCGAFGGDLELKSMLQWVAASQAERPFVLYFSFGDSHAERLQEVVDWIQREGWCVRDLLDMLLEYAKRRRLQQGIVGLFDWLLPRR